MRNILVKRARHEEAEERAKNYKKPKEYVGLRERIKHGIISVDEALSMVKSSEAGVIFSENILNWLERKKREKFKAQSKKKTTKKKRTKKKK
tara:strand:+ start:12978 stop:13253 length:276 start_codon:yes stop_codon:yes gene_type:complete